MVRWFLQMAKHALLPPSHSLCIFWNVEQFLLCKNFSSLNKNIHTSLAVQNFRRFVYGPNCFQRAENHWVILHIATQKCDDLSASSGQKNHWAYSTGFSTYVSFLLDFNMNPNLGYLSGEIRYAEKPILMTQKISKCNLY